MDKEEVLTTTGLCSGLCGHRFVDAATETPCPNLVEFSSTLIGENMS